MVDLTVDISWLGIIANLFLQNQKESNNWKCHITIDFSIIASKEYKFSAIDFACTDIYKKKMPHKFLLCFLTPKNLKMWISMIWWWHKRWMSKILPLLLSFYTYDCCHTLPSKNNIIHDYASCSNSKFRLFIVQVDWDLETVP